MRDPAFNQSELQPTTQTAIYGTPDAATAGAMTTRAAAEAFFIAGTNRAMFRFTLMNHMCMDMEQVHDTSIAPDRIRQDVSRSPGGDSRVFLNNCIGCHAGMDPLAQAFAYYDFDETSTAMVYNPAAVHSKYFNNDTTFADGFVTPNDSWHNHWRQGQNALIGWNAALPGQGTGAQVARRGARRHASVRAVPGQEGLQGRVPARSRGRERPRQIDAMTNAFRGAYNLKQVFAETAGYCMGQLGPGARSDDDAVRKLDLGRIARRDRDRGAPVRASSAARSAPASLLAAALLSACSGGSGADVEQIAGLPGNGPTSNYNGPAPSTPDVQQFKINLWDNVQANNRCGTCHSDTGGQAPMFARRDDINLAYCRRQRRRHARRRRRTR